MQPIIRYSAHASLLAIFLTADLIISFVWVASFSLCCAPIIKMLDEFWIGTPFLPLSIYKSILEAVPAWEMYSWESWRSILHPRLLRVSTDPGTLNVMDAFYISTLFVSIWLLLFVLSRYLIAALQSFDALLAHFNRLADIDNKPLSAIGLVAGALVAILWWTVVIVHRFV